MKTVKIMAITGMGLFPFFFIAALGFGSTVREEKAATEADINAMQFCLITVALYGLALSIVAFIQARKIFRRKRREGVGEHEGPPPIPARMATEQGPGRLSRGDSKIVAVQPFDEEFANGQISNETGLSLRKSLTRKRSRFWACDWRFLRLSGGLPDALFRVFLRGGCRMS